MANEQKITFKVTVNSKEAEEAFRRLAEGQNAVIQSSGRLKDAHNKGAGGFRENRQAALEFGRVIQDLPYGINGVANNITRLAEVIGLGGGAITAVSLLTTGLVMWAASSRKAKEESEKWDLKSLIGDTNAYADSLNKVVKELSAMSDTQLSKKIGELNKELADNMRYLTYIVKLKEMGGIGQAISWILGGGEDEADKIKKIKDTLTAAVPAIEGEKSWVGQIRSKIKELEDSLEKATTKASAEKYAIQIEKLQKELNSLGKEKPIKIEEIQPMTHSEFARALIKSRGLDPSLVEKEFSENARLIQAEVDNYFKILNEELKTKWAPDELSKGSRWIDMKEIKDLSYEDIKKDYEEIFDVAQKSASVLRDVFDRTGEGFLSKMLDALDVVIRIAEVMESLGLMKGILSALGLAAGLATGGAGYAVGVAASGHVILGSKSTSQPIIIYNQLGDQTINKLVLDANNTNQRLRYNYASA